MRPTSALQTLNRQSVVEAAVQQLQVKILQGEFRPGEKLPTEAALTRALGVSRSTLREALSRLASLRLIHVQHGGSKTVLDYREHAGLEIVPALFSDSNGFIDVEMIRSVTELRAILAPDAARLAASRRSTTNAERLIEAARGMNDSGLSLDELTERSNAFWRQVITASGNLAYRLAFNSLQTAYTEHSSAFRQLIAAELQAGGAYSAVADAVGERDPVRACSAAKELVSIGNTLIFDAISAYKQEGGPR